MSTTSQLSPRAREAIIRADRRIYWFSRHWVLAFSLAYGAFVALPFLAPIFMQIGWTWAGRAIYFIYSFLCHQLPERSFFLFGPQFMYSLSDIQAAWQPTLDPAILRTFIGSPAMGWKVAWSDRMVSMYTSVLLFVWLLPRKVKPLPMWGLILLSLPMVIDGTSHFISDAAGISQGFRAENLWLAELTGKLLPESFYAGDVLGSFNSWMRLITGPLFGLGVVWLAVPYMDHYFNDMARLLEAKFERAGLNL